MGRHSRAGRLDPATSWQLQCTIGALEAAVKQMPSSHALPVKILQAIEPLMLSLTFDEDIRQEVLGSFTAHLTQVVASLQPQEFVRCFLATHPCDAHLYKAHPCGLPLFVMHAPL
jgi:hypothetical protein